MSTQKCTTSLKYVSTAAFVGRMPFPVDMLRYDSCFPATSVDAMIMVDTMDGTEATVLLTRYHDTKEPRWTDERWKSFGWKRADKR